MTKSQLFTIPLNGPMKQEQIAFGNLLVARLEILWMATNQNPTANQERPNFGLSRNNGTRLFTNGLRYELLSIFSIGLKWWLGDFLGNTFWWFLLVIFLDNFFSNFLVYFVGLFFGQIFLANVFDHFRIHNFFEDIFLRKKSVVVIYKFVTIWLALNSGSFRIGVPSIFFIPWVKNSTTSIAII